MALSLYDVTMTAYETMQQATLQLGGSLGSTWESLTLTAREPYLARANEIIFSNYASGVTEGTYNTTVGTAGLAVGSSPVTSGAVTQGSAKITLGAATLTGTAMPGDTFTLTAVWDLVTVGGVTTSGSGNTTGNAAVLITAATSLAGQIRAGQLFTISANQYSCTATTQAGAAGGFAANTILIPITPVLATSPGNGTAVTVGNVVCTVDAAALAASNLVTVNVRTDVGGQPNFVGGLPTVPTATVWGTYTTPGIIPSKANFIFDQAVLSNLFFHGGN